MKIKSKDNNKSPLKAPSKTLINLYGFLAVLLVLIPEWIAELTLIIKNNSHQNTLPKAKKIWETKPELILSIMSIKQLREMAYKLGLKGYSRENRSTLYKRLLKKMEKNSKATYKLNTKYMHSKCNNKNRILHVDP